MLALPDFNTLALAKLLLVPLAVLILLALERLIPWRAYWPGRAVGNWGLALLNGAVLALLPFASLLAAAQWASAQGWGLFNQLAWPGWLEGLLAFLALDLLVYLQHRFLHWQPQLWRLHRVHHSDVMLDVSTGLRFHPLEALISAAFKAGCVLLLGASATAATAFAMALTLGSLFSHSNLKLPAALQNYLRLWLVTPAMHRVHHSVIVEESQRNFGFFLPWWDFWLGSYQANSVQGEGLKLGQDSNRHPAAQRLSALLQQPFTAHAPNGVETR